jgi:hypothetical protein
MEARMKKSAIAALVIAALVSSHPAQARTVTMDCAGAPLQSDGTIPANAAKGRISLSAVMDTVRGTITVLSVNGTGMVPVGRQLLFNTKTKDGPAARSLWDAPDGRRFIGIQLMKAGTILFAGYVVSAQCQPGGNGTCNRQMQGTVEYYQARCIPRR